MKTDIIPNEEKLIFKDITKNNIEDLEKVIDSQTQSFKNLVYSNQKFIDCPLNVDGLHIYRILLAFNTYKNRSKIETPHAKQFFEDGFIYIENFVTEDNLNYLKKVVSQMSETGSTSKHLTFPDAIRKDNADEFFKQLINVPFFGSDSDRSYPRTSMWHYKHVSGDPQYKWHTDTFQPTMKCWLYVNDIDESNGALSLIPKSHLPTYNRLAWDYKNSVYNKSKEKSFRLAEFGSEENESQEIEKNSFLQPVTLNGKANTLIAVNTYGLHKRGQGEANVRRNSLSIQYRPEAFGNYSV